MLGNGRAWLLHSLRRGPGTAQKAFGKFSQRSALHPEVKHAALEFFGRGLFTLNLSGGSSSVASSSEGRSCLHQPSVVWPASHLRLSSVSTVSLWAWQE